VSLNSIRSTVGPCQVEVTHCSLNIQLICQLITHTSFVTAFNLRVESFLDSYMFICGYVRNACLDAVNIFQLYHGSTNLYRKL